MDDIDAVNKRLAVAAEMIRLKRESDVRLDLALTVAGVGMWDWDIEPDVLTWDRRMCRLFGEPVGTAKTYDTFFDKVIPEDQKRVQEAVNQSLVTGVPYDVNYTISLRDGSTRLIHARGLRHPNTENYKKLIGVCMVVRN